MTNTTTQVTCYTHESVFYELKQQLAWVKRCVDASQQQINILENSEGEIAARHEEINHVSATLNQNQYQSNCFTGPNAPYHNELQTHQQNLQNELYQWHHYVSETQQKTISNVTSCYDTAQKLQNKLINEILLKWKRQQKIGQIGADIRNLNTELDNMETLFDGMLTELIRLKTFTNSFHRYVSRQATTGGQQNGHIHQEHLQQLNASISDQITNFLWE